MKTLLEHYIETKLTGFTEPVRVGVKRGQKIGYSKQKYHSILLSALTNRTAKEIAVEVGITYGLMKFWRTERDFHEPIHELQMGFMVEILELCKTKQQKLNVAIREILKDSPMDVAVAPIPLVKFPEMQDSAAYNKDLVKGIVNVLTELYTKNDIFFQVAVFNFFEEHFKGAVEIITSVWAASRAMILLNLQHTLLRASEGDENAIKEAMLLVTLMKEMRDIKDLLPNNGRDGESMEKRKAT